ncbi:hypothetical protein FJK98_07245 [Micromonospora sp. HM134]|nr:hypothetical protein FJK98_07245 [Micromonospora sp. HM134]
MGEAEELPVHRWRRWRRRPGRRPPGDRCGGRRHRGRRGHPAGGRRGALPRRPTSAHPLHRLTRNPPAGRVDRPVDAPCAVRA